MRRLSHDFSEAGNLAVPGAAHDRVRRQEKGGQSPGLWAVSLQQALAGRWADVLLSLGKRITLISALMAVFCVVPMLMQDALGAAEDPGALSGMLLLFGTPGFALMSLVGLVVWIAGVVREASGS